MTVAIAVIAWPFVAALPFLGLWALRSFHEARNRRRNDDADREGAAGSSSFHSGMDI